MSLLFGVIAGVAYGLSAFGGGLVAWPLLVVGLGFDPHGALAIALLAVALCAAVAAGDAARARQCETGLALLLCAGALPAVIVAALVTAMMPVAAIAIVFGGVTLVVGALLAAADDLAGGLGVLPAPVALWRSPRRTLADGAGAWLPAWPGRLAILAAGIAEALACGLCGAPVERLGQRAFLASFTAQRFCLVGTLAFGLAALGVVGALALFVSTPATPGYAAGLFVLGAVAGMGLARRLDHPRLPRAANRAIGAALVLLAPLPYVALHAGWIAPG